jgi:hypothetical protein
MIWTCNKRWRSGQKHDGVEEMRRRKVEDIAEKVSEARLRWYGHVIRRDEGELVRNIMELKR